MSQSTPLEVARELIRELLVNGPMKGATLKLRMLSAFEEATGETFNIAFRAYPKFSSFLLANTDIVDIQRPPIGQSGDIVVCLRAQTDEVRGSLDLLGPPAFYLLNGVWQAFTNPDPDRRRYIDRVSGRVIHHRKGVAPPELISDPSWIEINPVPALEQTKWMHDFLNLVAVSEGKIDLLKSIADMPYSANSNALFSKTLAEYADAWRRFRAGQVMRVVRSWSDETGVPFEKIAQPVTKATPTPTQESREAALRNTLIKAIRSASLEELRQISVPASLLNFYLHADGR
jgi:hypothetical protein